jgi:prepilin-type N-terminal cleavage/methylation domain-containing protein
MKQGFTLIELLVVIAIIGILSLGVFTILESARTQARAANAVQMLQQIEKAIQVEYASQARYPTEGEFGLGSNPEINTLIDNGYLSSLSSGVDYNIQDISIEYDNDRDSRGECGSSGDGVAIFIRNVPSGKMDVVNEIETLVDGNDDSCGKIQTTSNSLFYRLQNDADKFP